MDDAKKSGEEFARLVQILDTLRGENGCPWDRKQNIRTIVNYFLEEVYEAVDAVCENDAVSAAEELGDVLMEIVFLCRIFKESQKFNISDVITGINQKMIRRHPHVFGTDKVEDSFAVADAWNKQKKAEKERESVLQGIAGQSPALLTSFQLGLRAAAVGFDWEKMQDVLEKVQEETAELEQAINSNNKDAMYEEIGDLFFSLANLARHMKINPEIALRLANKKFISRFNFIEARLREQGKEPESATLEEMEKLWELAKAV